MTQPADVAVRGESATPEDKPRRIRRTTASLSEWTHANVAALIGAVLSTAAALALFTRFSLNGALSRDESIYVYGAVRFSHGVPPYVSIFDPKTPATTLLGGFGAGFARLTGHSELYGIRVEFLVISVLTVLAVYLLALQLFGSVSAAVVAGIAFSCYTKFAADAMAGPDAKTPGVLFMVVCMLLLARRRWFAAGVFGGLAFLVWQPLLWFPLICVLAAAITADAGRRRAAVQAVGGVIFPIAAVSVYFLIAGAFSEFITSAFVYPVTGTERPPESFGKHVNRIVDTIGQFPLTNLIFWVGTACLVVLVAARLLRNRGNARTVLTSPLVLVVTATFVLNLLYALYDFQRAPDTLPLLPYPVLGLAGAMAGLQTWARRKPVLFGSITAIWLAVVLVMGTFGFVRFGRSHSLERGLVTQLREACGVERIAGDHPVIALGSPTVLVLLHRVSRSKYIYLDAGVDKWKIDHTKGGLDAWGRQILAARPDVVMIDGWQGGAYTRHMRHFLRASGYARRYVGTWRVYVNKAADLRALRNNVRLSDAPEHRATNWQDGKLPARVPC